MFLHYVKFFHYFLIFHNNNNNNRHHHRDKKYQFQIMYSQHRNVSTQRNVVQVLANREYCKNNLKIYIK
jgi:hypothetical protein